MALEGADPIFVALFLFLIGASAVLAAKIAGLTLMRGRFAHRIGDRMGGARATVSEWSGYEGFVLAGGERWRARSNEALRPGDAVAVVSMDGLELRVRKK